jgi:Zn-dependent protease
MSLQVATIMKIPIRIHFTLLIVFSLITWTLASGFMPELYPGLSSSSYWLMGISGAAILMGSVLLHELSHAMVALRYGMHVRQIMLFIFGGVAQIDEDYDEQVRKDYRKEFNVAIAGPIMSFAIAGVLALFWWLSGLLLTEAASEPVLVANGILMYGAMVNGLIGGFNLLPAFPLDGGRILRASLMKHGRDYDSATRISVRLGIIISYVMMGFGFFTILGGSFIGGLWLILIGWFLQSGAQNYLSQHELSGILSRVRLAEIMRESPIAIQETLTLDYAVSNYFDVYRKSAFPVVNSSGHLVGMITADRAIKVPLEERTASRVSQIMYPKSEIIVMKAGDSAMESLMLMAKKHHGRTFVCDSDGRLVGLVSKTDIIEAVNERKEYIVKTTGGHAKRNE